jgi:urease accessory protein
MTDAIALLRLLQLANPTLPVGAYSYSEGLEFLIEIGKINHPTALTQWLTDQLNYGSIRIDAAVLVRGYQAMQVQAWDRLSYWNNWLTASREAEELRSQHWQMGQSLLRLWQDLQPVFPDDYFMSIENCNFAIAYAIVAADWQLDLHATVLSYLQSWAVNLVSAGVKLMPLGQTAGQKLLLNLQPAIAETAKVILALPDDALESCSWGLALASMAHETQYSRLFRS